MTIAEAPPLQTYRVVGQRVRPVNANRKCSGEVEYIGDMQRPGMLWVQIVRSPYARARITGIDTDRARALPGVVDVLTYRDAPAQLWGEERKMDMEGVPTLSDQVHFVGDIVAAIAAEDEDILHEAARLLRVTYEPLKPVIDPVEAAGPDAEQIHPYGNVICGDALHPTDQNVRGDVEQGFAQADVVLERTYRQPQVAGVPHEPRACIAEWDGSKLTLQDSTQFPFQTQKALAQILGLEASRVRVIATNMGGAFGMKLPPSRYAVIVSLIAMRTGRPAKIWFTREEETLDSHMRPGLVHQVKAGITRDGQVTAFQARSYIDNGYWAGIPEVGAGTAIPRDLCRIPMELYNRIPNVRWEAFLVRTNKPRSGAFRARGCAEPLFALECMLDDLAAAVGVDPCEVRLRHSIQTGDMVEHLRARGIEPKPVSRVGFQECIRAGAEAIAWEQARATPRDGSRHVKRGVGMAGAIHHAGSVPGQRSECEVVVDAAGGICLFNGQPDQGSEQQTTLRQIVAENLGAEYVDVSSVYADTDLCPYDTGPIASRGLFATGSAAWRAADSVRQQIVRHAAEMAGEPEDRLSVRDGAVWLAPEGRQVATLGQVADFAGGELRGHGSFNGADEPTFTYGFAACFVEVEVDTDLGQVRVLRLVSSHDVGRAINPEIVEGQIEGGVAQGLGYALTEGMYYDARNGAGLNQWFLDLKTPTIADMPPVESLLLEMGNEGHPLGAKGCSEISLVGVAPAISNAIFNATGARVNEIPITPDRVLSALAEARGKE